MFADLESYLECAAWSSIDEDGDSIEHLSFSESAKTQMEEELNDFVKYCEENHPKELEEYAKDNTAKQFAHDFWLTRNGHGAGFWDRGLGEIGDKLSKMAKVHGSCDLYLNEETMEIEVA